MTAVSLYELNNMVHNTVESVFDQPVWIQAELAQVAERGQHCYLEFVQKAPDHSGMLLAKARGQIWARTWLVLRPYFERTTGQPLSAGMNVMVQVEVTFHELYGYSLNVVDINPTYTLGDLARRRQEIINQLRAEGIADMNKTLPLPVLLKRIAVISAEGAAGWGDFRSQLLDNPHHLAFTLKLFPATMQGENVESTVISALERVYNQCDEWDAVVIIRGGGATTDLSGFDSLLLAEHVAQFPIPVITGIGHERDDTVIDLVSHTRVKTPTAAAEFILHHQLAQLERLNTLSAEITSRAVNLLHMHRMKLNNMVATLPAIGLKTLDVNRLALSNIRSTLRQQVANRMERERNRLKLVETALRAADPHHVLRLGYSIVRKEGRAVTDATMISAGDTLQITLYKGTIEATAHTPSTDTPGGGEK